MRGPACRRRLSLTAERWEDDSQAVVLRLAVAGGGGPGRTSARCLQQQWLVHPRETLQRPRCPSLLSPRAPPCHRHLALLLPARYPRPCRDCGSPAPNAAPRVHRQRAGHLGLSGGRPAAAGAAGTWAATLHTRSPVVLPCWPCPALLGVPTLSKNAPPNASVPPSAARLLGALQQPAARAGRLHPADQAQRAGAAQLPAAHPLCIPLPD